MKSKDPTDIFRTRLSKLIERRTPWLILGLFGGMLATWIVSNFEKELSQTVALAFFIPVMVYMGDAVGTQTQMLFIRELDLGRRFNLFSYLKREFPVDLVMGLICSLLIFFFALLIFSSQLIALVMAVALFVIMATAGIINVFISWALISIHRDPAIGAGPLATIIQDIISLLIYFFLVTILFTS